LKIEALTLYRFRSKIAAPKTEIDFLMALLREYLRKEMPLIQKTISGCDSLAGWTKPTGVQNDVRDAMKKPRGTRHGAVRGTELCGRRRSLMP